MTKLTQNPDSAKAAAISLYLQAAQLRLLARKLGNIDAANQVTAEMSKLRGRIHPTRS